MAGTTEGEPCIRIVLAEDHAVVRESIKNFLGQVPGITIVGEAGDGREAVELATSLKPDVVIMDISMPVQNGIQATRQIKQQLPSAAVLILTAYDYDQYVFALLEAGAAGYLLKDVRGQELIDAIHAVYRGDSVLHPSVARKVMQRFQQSAGHRDEPAGLTERELEVLSMAAKGYRNRQIAERLFLSVRTVEAHLGSIFSKLGVGSRTEAVLVALRKGWLSLQDLE